MKLYGSFGSPFTRRVGTTLLLYNLKHEHLVLRANVPEELEQLKKINPLARIPALETDDGMALVDSVTILDYLDIKGASKKFTCPTSIDNFVEYMNQTIYGMKLLSPYGTPNGSWCRVNVTNCSPPGYMSACPSNPAQLGYLSVFKSSSNQIKVCSNLEYKNGSIVYLEDIISYE